MNLTVRASIISLSRHSARPDLKEDLDSRAQIAESSSIIYESTDNINTKTLLRYVFFLIPNVVMKEDKQRHVGH